MGKEAASRVIYAKVHGIIQAWKIREDLRDELLLYFLQSQKPNKPFSKPGYDSTLVALQKIYDDPINISPECGVVEVQELKRIIMVTVHLHLSPVNISNSRSLVASFAKTSNGKKHNEPDYSFSIKLIGESEAGASSLCERLCFGKNFSEHNAIRRGVVNAQPLDIKHADGVSIRLQVWDIRNERFDLSAKLGCRNFNAYIFLIDLTKNDIAQSDIYFAHMKKYISENSLKFLVGTKADLPCNLSQQRLKELADKFNLQLLESVSARTGKGTQEFLQTVTAQLVEEKQKELADQLQKEVSNLISSQQEGSNSGVCVLL